MRKLRLCALMMTLLFTLSACGGENLDQVVDHLTQQYQAVGSLSALASVTSHYEDRDASFQLRYQEENGSCSVTVEAPESLSGIVAIPEEDSLSLQFEDVVLAAGDFAGLELSPMALLPLLMRDFRQSFPTSYEFSSRDGQECVTLTYSTLLSGRDAEHVTTFDRQTYFPLESALYLEGTQIMTAVFEQFDCR